MTYLTGSRLARGAVLAMTVTGLAWATQAAERPGARPAATPPAPIGQGRNITLSEYYGFDFDTQQVTSKYLQMDLYLGIGIGAVRFQSVPGAGFPSDGGDAGEAKHGYVGCNSRPFIINGQPRAAIAGQYYCMRTAEGRLAEFRVDSVSGYAEHKPVVVISYVLWEK